MAKNKKNAEKSDNKKNNNNKKCVFEDAGMEFDNQDVENIQTSDDCCDCGKNNNNCR